MGKDFGGAAEMGPSGSSTIPVGRRLIDVTGKLRQFSPGLFNLFAERERQLRQFVLSAAPMEFHDRFVLESHSSAEIE
jgi:hypothetical protein